MAEGRMTDIFFPTPLDKEHPELWEIPADIWQEKAENLQIFWKHMDYSQVLGLFQALKEIEKKREKIQLIVDEGYEWMALTLCSVISVQYGIRLFLMVDGECTITPPDIVISDRINYLERYHYKKMSMEQLIQRGSIRESNLVQKKNDVISDEVEGLFRICQEYLDSEEISNEKLYECMELLLKKDPREFAFFRRYLKHRLAHIRIENSNIDRYMVLLYIVHKKRVDEYANDSMELCTAPYDFPEMFLFLRKKAKNKRELRKYLKVLLEIQFFEVADSTWENAVGDVARDISIL